MKTARIILSGRMRSNDVIPVDQVITAFEDPANDQVEVIIAGQGVYEADSCLALVNLIAEMHRKTGKPVVSNLLSSVGLTDFFIWLKCGINGRTIRPTARIKVRLPDWSRFSSVDCPQEGISESERCSDLRDILESINEYVPLAEYEGKDMTILNLDEFGLLQESYLHLMEKKNYGVAL
jgi:hypothetical protein